MLVTPSRVHASDQGAKCFSLDSSVALGMCSYEGGEREGGEREGRGRGERGERKGRGRGEEGGGKELSHSYNQKCTREQYLGYVRQDGAKVTMLNLKQV